MYDIDKYQAHALRTAKRVNLEYDLHHAGLGIAGEAGEFADCLKKHLIYNKPLDRANAVEELGDIMWFVAFACETLSVKMSEIAEQNLFKLSMRYPDKYTDLLARKRLDKTEAR